MHVQAEVDFFSELLFFCLMPWGLAALTFVFAHHVHSRDPSRSRSSVFTKVFLVVLFCIYPGVSRKVLSTFKCEYFLTAAEQGEHVRHTCEDLGYTWRDDACYRSFLRADYSLSCDASVDLH